MTIYAILRPRSATSGGEIREIGGEGPIDNRAEAESALNLIGAGGDNVVIVGSETYDRTRLERIRDGGGAGPVASVNGVSGTSAPGSLRVGTIRTSESVPPGSRLYLFIDGNPAGDSVTLVADRALPITLPGNTPDGRHEIQYRIARPNLPELRYTRMTEIRPSMATLSDVRVGPPTTGHGPAISRFMRDPIRLTFRTTLATEHRVRVAAGGHIEELTVPAGAVTSPATTREASVALSGQPGTWADIGGSGRRRTVGVAITPLGANGTTGTPVNAGNVIITTFHAPRSRQQAAVVPSASPGASAAATPATPQAAPATPPATPAAPATPPARPTVVAPPSTN